MLTTKRIVILSLYLMTGSAYRGNNFWGPDPSIFPFVPLSLMMWHSYLVILSKHPATIPLSDSRIFIFLSLSLITGIPYLVRISVFFSTKKIPLSVSVLDGRGPLTWWCFPRFCHQAYFLLVSVLDGKSLLTWQGFLGSQWQTYNFFCQFLDGRVCLNTHAFQVFGSKLIPLSF